MIDTIRSFTLPYTQFVMGERNLIIVLFGLGLFALIILYLLAHWRVQRLQLDLAEERATTTTAGRKAYVPVSPAPEEVIDRANTLPPVRAGRTYARNLGTALQKAGISGTVPGPGGQPIYTPPAPGGWNPNPGAALPPGVQGQPPTYSPPLPWGTPMPPTATPGGWPYAPPLGPVSPPLPQTPTEAAAYYPPTVPVAPPGALAGPASPPFPAPAPYGAPQSPAPQSTPSVHVGADTPAVQPPATASFGAPPMVTPQAPVEESGPQPKRRRFGLHVLQNLEKALQEKAASLIEAAPLRSGTKAPAPPASPAAPAAPAMSPAPAMQSAPATPPAPVAPTPPATPPAPVTPTTPATPVFGAMPFASSTSPAPLAPPGPAVPSPPIAPPTPPAGNAFPFESFAAKRVAQPAPSAPAPMQGTREKPPREKAQPAGGGQRPEHATASTARDEVQNVTSAPLQSQVDSSRESSRTAMRAMLFGDEPVPPPSADIVEPVDALSAQEGAEPGEFYPAAETEPVAPMEALSEEPTLQLETATPPAEETVSRNTAEIVGAALPDLESTVEAAPKPPAVSAAPASEAESTWVIDEETPLPFEPTEPSPAPEPARSGKGTIVIIEDDEQVGQYYATLLGGNGYAVEVATNGSSGVDLCTRLRPQVILLDVMMPRQNGILVLQTLRATDETRETPVVVLSNFSEPTLIRRALQLGALEYVIKTQVDGATLLQAIPRWMNHEKAFAS